MKTADFLQLNYNCKSQIELLGKLVEEGQPLLKYMLEVPIVKVKVGCKRIRKFVMLIKRVDSRLYPYLRTQ